MECHLPWLVLLSLLSSLFLFLNPIGRQALPYSISACEQQFSATEHRVWSYSPPTTSSLHVLLTACASSWVLQESGSWEDIDGDDALMGAGRPGHLPRRALHAQALAVQAVRLRSSDDPVLISIEPPNCEEADAGRGLKPCNRNKRCRVSVDIVCLVEAGGATSTASGGGPDIESSA